MEIRKIFYIFKYLFCSCIPFLLIGCDAVLIDSKGQTGIAERDLIFVALGLMSIVVVPVFIMVFVFAWKYRSSNKKAEYLPDWAHSNKIEWTVWGVPIGIIAILAIITWITTHTLDPKRAPVSKNEPMTIEVVSLDWKWLFIYPDQNIATVNEVAFPVDTPIKFDLTSNTVMNSFFIPQLGGQLYAMAGMKNTLYLLANEEGIYDGISAHYSGAGFSGMKFKAHVGSEQEFDQWVNKVRNSQDQLDLAAFENLNLQSKNNPVQYFSRVEDQLYQKIIEPFMGGMMGMEKMDHIKKDNMEYMEHMGMEHNNSPTHHRNH